MYERHHSPLGPRQAKPFPRWAFWSLSLLGTGLYCLYDRAWRDLWRVAYDLPASLVVFAFGVRLVARGISGPRDTRWWSQVWLLAPLAVLPAGREFLGWPISGHLSTVTAAAGAQTRDAALPPVARVLIWAPAPLVLWLRWSHLDGDRHGQTYWALATGIGMALVAELAQYVLTRARARSAP